MNERVSIITATRNAVDVLRGCLESVSRQNDPNLEHVIIDGRSEDGTVELLRSWNGHRIVWTSEPDGGISDAFNKGIGKSTGSIIGILNADDRYSLGAVERARGALVTHPSAGFCFGHCMHRESDGRMWLNLGDAAYGERLRHFMPDVNHPTMFVRRSAYDTVGGYDCDWRLAMDYDWLYRAHRAGIRGVLIDSLQAEMAMGGLSDRCWRSSYSEARRIAIRYGCPAIEAWVDHLGRLAKGTLRRSLVHLGFKDLERRIRIWRQRRILAAHRGPEMRTLNMELEDPSSGNFAATAAICAKPSVDTTAQSHVHPCG